MSGVDKHASAKKALEVTSAVGIELDGAIIGSGVLIRSDFVLTVAHVAKSLSPMDSRSTVLLTDNQGESEHVSIESVYMHPDYVTDEATNDIALIKLSTAVDTSKYVPATLYRGLLTELENQYFYKVGYGLCPLEEEDDMVKHQKLYYENRYSSAYDKSVLPNFVAVDPLSSETLNCHYWPEPGAPLGVQKHYDDNRALKFQGVIFHGDSGSPDFNDKNEVVGIASSALSVGKGYNDAAGMQQRIEAIYLAIYLEYNSLHLLVGLDVIDFQLLNSDLEVIQSSEKYTFFKRHFFEDYLPFLQTLLAEFDLYYDGTDAYLRSTIDKLNKLILLLITLNHHDHVWFYGRSVPICNYLEWVDSTIDYVTRVNSSGRGYFSNPLSQSASYWLIYCLSSYMGSKMWSR
ncbi:MAG: hypothetical protein Tsb0018_03820 [Opitutales bacterium]